MSDDVTIPAAVARKVADEARAAADGGYAVSGRVLRAWADALDQPPSLRDEVARLLEPLLLHDTSEDARQAIDDILAVVRRHVEALPTVTVMDGVAGTVRASVERDDVLRLLGGDQ